MGVTFGAWDSLLFLWGGAEEGVRGLTPLSSSHILRASSKEAGRTLNPELDRCCSLLLAAFSAISRFQYPSRVTACGEALRSSYVGGTKRDLSEALGGP